MQRKILDGVYESPLDAKKKKKVKKIKEPIKDSFLSKVTPYYIYLQRPLNVLQYGSLLMKATVNISKKLLYYFSTQKVSDKIEIKEY